MPAGLSAFLLQKFGIFPSPQAPAHPAVPPSALQTTLMVSLCSKLIFLAGTERDTSFLLCCPQSCSCSLLVLPVTPNRRGNNYIWGNFTPICVKWHRQFPGREPPAPPDKILCRSVIRGVPGLFPTPTSDTAAPHSSARRRKRRKPQPDV